MAHDFNTPQQQPADGNHRSLGSLKKRLPGDQRIRRPSCRTLWRPPSAGANLTQRDASLRPQATSLDPPALRDPRPVARDDLTC
ncbi:hypothetical protein ACPA9J_18320 [Pseudomonas aeruginosa]